MDVNAISRRLEEIYGKSADAKIVAEPARRVGTPAFDGTTMMDSLAREVLSALPPSKPVELPKQESYKPVEGIESMAVTDILALETHQQSHNQTNPVVGCKFCDQETELNKENSNGNTV